MAQTLKDLDRRVSALERAEGDTTDTLKWVVAKLGRSQAVQDEHTLRLERLETKWTGSMDSNPSSMVWSKRFRASLSRPCGRIVDLSIPCCRQADRRVAEAAQG